MYVLTRILLVASVVLLGACTEEGGLLAEDDGPTTDEGDEAAVGDGGAGTTVSALCSDVMSALEDMVGTLGDTDSVTDIASMQAMLGDSVDELESLAGRIDDVEVEGDAEQAVADALQEAVASARAAADAATGDDLGAARTELDQMIDRLGEARDAAQEADIDC